MSSSNAPSSHNEEVFNKAKNLFNFIVMISVSVPIFVSGYLTNGIYCENAQNNGDQTLSWAALKLDQDSFCKLGLFFPLLFINLVFFVCICITFWLLSLLQGSTWLIDPYWTFIPPIIGLYCITHPVGSRSRLRSTITFVLILIWSVRLTHSYFRREKWNCGEREDWRFSDKRKEMGRNWWWYSLFYAFVSQQPMLVGLCLPLYAVNFEDQLTPFSSKEILFVAICLLGIGIAFVADNQLYNYMQENVRRRSEGKEKILLLDKGLWKYSRHPNYFGEQLWWWSLAGFSCACGAYWTLIGPAFNSLVMAAVTGLTEDRMLKNTKRLEVYRRYQKETSVWIPVGWWTWKAKNI